MYRYTCIHVNIYKKVTDNIHIAPHAQIYFTYFYLCVMIGFPQGDTYDHTFRTYYTYALQTIQTCTNNDIYGQTHFTDVYFCNKFF